jgi:hypothetical protein
LERRLAIGKIWLLRQFPRNAYCSSAVRGCTVAAVFKICEAVCGGQASRGGIFQPIHSLWKGCGLEPGGCWSDGGPLGVAGWLTPSNFCALLAHVALEADVVVALREARMSFGVLRHTALRFAHRSSDRQRRDSDARSASFWRTSRWKLTSSDASVSHAAWDVHAGHSVHNLCRPSERLCKRRLLHERACA